MVVTAQLHAGKVTLPCPPQTTHPHMECVPDSGKPGVHRGEQRRGKGLSLAHFLKDRLLHLPWVLVTQQPCQGSVQPTELTCQQVAAPRKVCISARAGVPGSTIAPAGNSDTHPDEKPWHAGYPLQHTAAATQIFLLSPCSPDIVRSPLKLSKESGDTRVSMISGSTGVKCPEDADKKWLA